MCEFRDTPGRRPPSAASGQGTREDVPTTHHGDNVGRVRLELIYEHKPSGNGRGLPLAVVGVILGVLSVLATLIVGLIQLSS